MPITINDNDLPIVWKILRDHVAYLHDDNHYGYEHMCEDSDNQREYEDKYGLETDEGNCEHYLKFVTEKRDKIVKPLKKIMERIEKKLKFD